MNWIGIVVRKGSYKIHEQFWVSLHFLSVCPLLSVRLCFGLCEGEGMKYKTAKKMEEKLGYDGFIPYTIVIVV